MKGENSMEKYKFELVVVWSTGEKEVHKYITEQEAEQGAENMRIAFGSQVWVCVRPAMC